MIFEFDKTKCLVCGEKSIHHNKTKFDMKISCNKIKHHNIIYSDDFISVTTDKYLIDVDFYDKPQIFFIKIYDYLKTYEQLCKTIKIDTFIVPSIIDDEYVENLLLLN